MTEIAAAFRKALIGLVLLFGAVSSATAQAAHPPPMNEHARARIEELLAVAKDQRQRKDYPGAIVTLEQAIAVYPAPWLFYSLGRLREDLNQLARARNEYQRALGADPDPETRERCEAGLLRLASAGTLRLSIAPSDAQVTIDGQLWPRHAWEGIALVAGRHELVVERAGHAKHAQSVVIGAGKTTAVAVALTPDEVGGPGHGVSERRERGPDFGPWPWVALGAGAVAAGIGTYLFVDGHDDWDEAEKGTALPQSEREALLDRGTPKVNGGAALIVTGGVLIAGGVVLAVLDGSAEGGGAASFVPVLGPDELVLTLQGSF